jgi:alpha-glucosidase
MVDNKNMQWWQRGVVYQIYPRSFMDANGDGVGDLAGILQELDYLNDGTSESLGVDAIWISPIFPSPMADFGYDVSDYCDIDPLFGDLATFDRLLAACHNRGIKVILDWVPNHTSDRHPWFQESRHSRDHPKRDWYIWRDAKPDGAPPNNWGSFFGGPAWTFDERTGQYYLHQFVKEQPELNWRNPEVKEAMLDTLRFWLRRGVDGFRMDVIGLIYKDPELRDNPPNPHASPDLPENDLHGRQLQLFNMDQDDVHGVLREIRAVLDEFEDRCGIGELWGPLDRWVRYYGERGDELHMPFNFRLMAQPWQAAAMRQSVDQLEAALPDIAWPNYVLGNHDQIRLATRFGGQAQARVAAMMLLTLRGTPTLYYGDEIGLENGLILPHQVQDPQGINLGVERTRDVCRTPMQWDSSPNAGFSAHQPWLPVSPDYATRNVAAQAKDPFSILNLYRKLLQVRRQSAALFGGSYHSLDAGPDCFAYLRQAGDERFLVVLNFSPHHQSLKLDDLVPDMPLLSQPGPVDSPGPFRGFGSPSSGAETA